VFTVKIARDLYCNIEAWILASVGDHSMTRALILEGKRLSLEYSLELAKKNYPSARKTATVLDAKCLRYIAQSFDVTGYLMK